MRGEEVEENAERQKAWLSSKRLETGKNEKAPVIKGEKSDSPKGTVRGGENETNNKEDRQARPYKKREATRAKIGGNPKQAPSTEVRSLTNARSPQSTRAGNEKEGIERGEKWKRHREDVQALDSEKTHSSCMDEKAANEGRNTLRRKRRPAVVEGRTD